MVILDMPMPKNCGECPLCMIVYPMCSYCMAGRFQVKYSELDLRDGMCPLIEKGVVWFSVKDKMPRNGTKVFIKIKYFPNSEFQALYFDCGFHDNNGRKFDDGDVLMWSYID